MAYINTTDSFFIKGDKLPGFIDNLKKAKIKYTNANATKTNSTNDPYNDTNGYGSLEEQKECGYDPTAPVPITKRPAALVCRGKQVAKKPFKLSITFPNMDFSNFGAQEKEQLSTPFANFGKDINNFSDQW